MRRPPIACQRAVQSLQSPAPQHVWVPDDVLSLAVHRFFRTTCPSQKRHGSNVPGPLEARRRAAKRRMTASAGAFPQDGLPTSFSLSALFGYRSAPQNAWRYEPPSLPRNPWPLDTPPLPWDSSQSSNLQPRSQATDSKPSAYTVPLSSAQQAVPEPTQEIDSRSANLDAHLPNDNIDLESCLEDFRARVGAATGGQNKLLKESFMQCLPSTPSVWKYYVAVLRHTLQLGHNPTSVLESLLERDGHLLRSVDPLLNVDDCADFLDRLDSVASSKVAKRVRASVLSQTTTIIAQSAAQGRRSETELHDAVLLRLIQRVGYYASAKGSNQVVPTMDLLSALAAKLSQSTENTLLLSHLAQSQNAEKIIVSTVSSVVAVPDRFASAERALSYTPRLRLLAQIPAVTLQLARKITNTSNSPTSVRRMSVWLRLLQRVDKSLLKAALVSLAKEAFSRNSTITVPSEILIEAMLLHQDIDAQTPSLDKKKTRFQDIFAATLLRLQALPMAYNDFLDMALPFISDRAGITLLLHCVRAMEEQKLPLSENVNFDALIAKDMDSLRASTGDLSESQLEKRAYVLQACEKLIKALSRLGYALPARTEQVTALAGIRQFDHLLSRAKANSSLPIAYRDISKDMTLMERVALVHQLAHHYSLDTTRTHREAWRAIYYLYRYLTSNSLPIGPLFTKAVVHCSITRPLSENRFVSARRLIWVCRLVARVEGDEVAARVENLFHTWRGDLIGRAKRIYIGVGGRKQDKAHVGTMKRLGLI